MSDYLLHFSPMYPEIVVSGECASSCAHIGIGEASPGWQSGFNHLAGAVVGLRWAAQLIGSSSISNYRFIRRKLLWFPFISHFIMPICAGIWIPKADSLSYCCLLVQGLDARTSVVAKSSIVFVFLQSIMTCFFSFSLLYKQIQLWSCIIYPHLESSHKFFPIQYFTRVRAKSLNGKFIQYFIMNIVKA